MNFRDQDPSLMDDLHWQSFRYIAGEMADEELTTFERLLGDSQKARESVARVVGQTQTIDAALGSNQDVPVNNSPVHRREKANVSPSAQQTLIQKRNRKRRSVNWIASIVAMLALILGASFLFPGATASADDDDLVAELWADAIEFGSDFDEMDIDPTDNDGEADWMSPEWLLDAVDSSDEVSSNDDSSYLQRSSESDVGIDNDSTNFNGNKIKIKTEAQHA